MNLEALKENILKGYYQEHPQGKQLLDVDLCDMFSEDALAIENLEDYSAKLEEAKDEEIDALKKDIEEYSRNLEASDRANDELESEIALLKAEKKRKIMKIDKSLTAALKMNNRQLTIAGVLAMVGAEDEQIEEAENASRVTGALIDRLFKPYLDEDEGKETPEPQEEPESEATPQETVCDSLETKSFPDICEHLEAGHGKKAFKLCKKAKKAGTRGSVLTGLTRKAKEMKDA